MAELSKAPLGYFVPPPDRPRWVGYEDVSRDLLYLGWGRRYHGRHPAPSYRHAGWMYILLTRGSPTYVINDAEVRPAPSTLIIVHPECAFGVRDRPTGCCQWLLWVWAEPPRHGLQVPHGGHTFYNAPPKDVPCFRQIHDRCRLEVAQPDTLTAPALRLQHEMLDLALARLAETGRPMPCEKFLVDMAIYWLKLNVTTREPVGLLCEYLQISASTLNRLFQRHLGESPGRHHQKIRMGQAQEALKRGTASVKEIGFKLGFAHSGDFTRAYRRYYDRLPSGERRSNVGIGSMA